MMRWRLEEEISEKIHQYTTLRIRAYLCTLSTLDSWCKNKEWCRESFIL